MKKTRNLVKRIDPEKLVIKDNALIMASYSLSVEEQRLLLASIQKAHSQKEPLNANLIKVTLSVNEYAEIYNVEMVTAYKALSKSSDRLYDRSITIKSEGKEREIRWLQEKAKYDSGKVELIFTNEVSKHISEVVTKQTAYRLAQATQLRTQHSIRLFEIFQTVIDHENQEGEWEVSVDDFKDTLRINDSYERWIDLKKKVITPAISMINRNTSLKVEWKIAGKEGKRITGIRFIVFETDQLNLGLE